MRAAALLVALLASAGCAHVKNKGDTCPEYRELSCASGIECSFDKSRGCDVCRCEDATTTNQTPTDPALSPEKRDPDNPLNDR